MLIRKPDIDLVFLGGHCKKLAPEWEKLAKSMEGIIKVGAVNGDDEANRELAAYYQIRGSLDCDLFFDVFFQGFPTIKFFGSKIEPTPDGKGYHKVAVDYNVRVFWEADLIEFRVPELLQHWQSLPLIKCQVLSQK